MIKDMPVSVKSVASSVTNFQKQFEDGLVPLKDEQSKISKAQVLSYIASRKSAAPSISIDSKKKKMLSLSKASKAYGKSSAEKS